MFIAMKRNLKEVYDERRRESSLNARAAKRTASKDVWPAERRPLNRLVFGVWARARLGNVTGIFLSPIAFVNNNEIALRSAGTEEYSVVGDEKERVCSTPGL
ncbi:hypothetical protein Ddc_11867 [Ditylenchus destructor]|nr:hypothetical protein Ddc_11867 [Ditylenchus destructor]